MSFGLIGSSVAVGLGASATTAAALGAGTAFLAGSAGGGGDTVSSTQVTDSTTRKQLEVSQSAIDKLVGDVLGSEQGLASIFSKENVAGLYDSTVSAQASGDLVANLIGEIAKLTSPEVTTTTGTVEKETEEDEGFLKKGEAGLDFYRKLLNLDVAP